MKLKIEMTLENAAFYEDPGYEVARILRDLAHRVENKQEFADYRAGIVDSNGNRVGELTTYD